MHRLTTTPVALVPARTRWAAAAGAGAAFAAAWWLGDTAPYPYTQRCLLGVPLPFASTGTGSPSAGCTGSSTPPAFT
ncbi:hypothetical protein ACF1AY_38760 [Streptomyces sp. NPDC014776]|uniref:hypothetical protein n=1 Tax=unclassified Streptomyces TaxID=2593676 RepID=UPI00370322D2